MWIWNRNVTTPIRKCSLKIQAAVLTWSSPFSFLVSITQLFCCSCRLSLTCSALCSNLKDLRDCITQLKLLKLLVIYGLARFTTMKTLDSILTSLKLYAGRPNGRNTESNVRKRPKRSVSLRYSFRGWSAYYGNIFYCISLVRYCQAVHRLDGTGDVTVNFIWRSISRDMHYALVHFRRDFTLHYSLRLSEFSP